MINLKKQIIEITDLIEYSEDSPSCLIWTKDFGKGRFIRKAGDTVGNITKYPALYGRDQFYWKFGYKYKTYTNHRVVWVLFNGDIPANMVINHKDNNSLNNNINNLELVTYKENSQKTYYHNGIEIHSTNKTGVLGVSNKVEERNGKLYFYAHAKYRDENSKSVNKYFRYDPNDEESKTNAFLLAKKWRESQLKLLINNGLAFYKLDEDYSE